MHVAYRLGWSVAAWVLRGRVMKIRISNRGCLCKRRLSDQNISYIIIYHHLSSCIIIIDHHISIFKLFRKMIRNQTKSEKTPRATVFSYSTRCNWRPLIGDLFLPHFLPHFLHRPRWRWCSIGGCSSTGWTMEPTWCPAWVAASLPSRSLDNLRKLFYDFLWYIKVGVLVIWRNLFLINSVIGL